MKKFILSLSTVMLVAFGISGCAPQEDPKQAQQNVTAAIEQAPKITFEESLPGAHADTRRNFYVVFDGSGSMGDGCGEGDKQFDTKIEGAKWALKEFISKVPNDVNLGLYVFDSWHDEEVVPLGSGNRDSFFKAVDEFNAGGGTPLPEAIDFATAKLVEQYKKQLGYGEYRLIVVTDGQANGIPGAALNAIKSGIAIYTIGFCMDGSHPLQQYSLSYRAAGNSTDLARGLEETLAESKSFDASEFTSQ